MSEEKILNLNRENVESPNTNGDKISIADFVNKYSKMASDKAKEALIQSVVRNNDYYVPYNEKFVYANQIIENSSFDKNGNIHYNGAKQYQLYIATILALYTKLDVPSDTFNITFDILNQNRLLDIIVEAMPSDKDDFDIMLSMAKDDFDRNYGMRQMDINNITNAVYKGLIKGINDIFDGINIDTLNISEMQELFSDIMQKVMISE